MSKVVKTALLDFPISDLVMYDNKEKILYTTVFWQSGHVHFINNGKDAVSRHILYGCYISARY